MEIPDFPHLHHIGIDRPGDHSHFPFLDPKSLAGIVSAENAKSKKLFDLAIAFRRPHF